MEQTSYFRVQRAEIDVNDLLDPGMQFSHALNGASHFTREGVSTCTSLDDLALYLVSHIGTGIGAAVRSGGAWVIVELQGEELPGATDLEFEQLIRPARIVSVTPVAGRFLAMMDEQVAFLASFTDPNAD